MTHMKGKIMNAVKRCLAILGFAIFVAGCRPAIADKLVVPVDVSASSPVFTAAYLARAAQRVAERIRTLPVGSQVTVFLVGDSRADSPFVRDLHVQRGPSEHGDTAKALATAFPAFLRNVIAEVQRKPVAQQSHLTAGVRDASRLCERKPCEIMFLTDGLEWQSGIVEWPRDTTRDLPRIKDLTLTGVRIELLGIGQGVAPKTQQAIEAHWRTWLSQAGASEIVFRRL
jgi:hypothetical protein